MAIIKKSMNNKCWRGVKKREPSCIIGGNVNWYSHYGEQYGGSLKKLGLKPPYDPAIPLLGIYPEETIIERVTCIPMFIAALFTIARTGKQPRCPSTDGRMRWWYICTMEYYSAMKECIWVSSNEVDERRAYYTEWCKSERQR